MGDKKSSLERLHEVASNEFKRRDFDDVSVAEIAAQAHCSTTTIYEVYGSKVGLYMAVRFHTRWVGGAPLPKEIEGQSPLEVLLEFARSRITYLSSQTSASAFRYPEQSDREHISKLTRTAMVQNNPLGLVKIYVEKCIDARLLRHGDTASTAYTICAGVGFEAIIERLAFGREGKVNPAPIINMVFRCLVTKRGLQQLNRFLLLFKDDHSASAPSLLAYSDIDAARFNAA